MRNYTAQMDTARQVIITPEMKGVAISPITQHNIQSAKKLENTRLFVTISDSSPVFLGISKG